MIAIIKIKMVAILNAKLNLITNVQVHLVFLFQKSKRKQIYNQTTKL